MNPWLLLTVLVLIALAAPRYGVDSRWLRPGEAPHPRRGPTPLGDLAALVRRVRRPSWPASWSTARALDSRAARP